MSTILKALRRLEADRSPDTATDGRGPRDSSPPDVDADGGLRERLLVEELAAEAAGFEGASSDPASDPVRGSTGAFEGAVGWLRRHALVLAATLVLMLAVGVIALGLRSPAPEAASTPGPVIAAAPSPAALERPPSPAAPSSAPAASPLAPPPSAPESSPRVASQPAIAASAIPAPAEESAAAPSGDTSPSPSPRAAGAGAAVATAVATTSGTSSAASTPLPAPTASRSASAAPPDRLAARTSPAPAVASPGARPSASTAAPERTPSPPAPAPPAPQRATARPASPTSARTAPAIASSASERASARHVATTPERASRKSDAAAAAELPRIATAPIPDVEVVRTAWHPDPARRSARIRLLASGELVTLAEGDAAGALVIKEITPSSVLFSTGDVEIRRRVGD